MNDFVKKVKELGPLGEGEGMDEKALKLKLEAVTEAGPLHQAGGKGEAESAGQIGRRVP